MLPPVLLLTFQLALQQAWEAGMQENTGFSFCITKSLLLTVSRNNKVLSIFSHMDGYSLQCSKLAFFLPKLCQTLRPVLK